MIYVADGHAIIWMMYGSPKLGKGACSILRNSKSRVELPAAALAEIIYLYFKWGLVSSSDEAIEKIKARKTTGKLSGRR